MKIKKHLLVILTIAFTLSITGFIIDLNERVQDINTNIFEIMMMTGVIFVLISVFYFPLKFIVISVRKHKLLH
jgi:hypothetical protein